MVFITLPYNHRPQTVPIPEYSTTWFDNGFNKLKKLSPHLLKHLLPDLPPQDDDDDRHEDGNDGHQTANQDPGIAFIHFMSRVIS